MRRFHVDDAIPEALVGARAPVVGLIRIKHDDLPGQAFRLVGTIEEAREQAERIKAEEEG